MLTIFSKSNCPFCDKTKAYLASKNVPFVERKVDEDISLRNFLIAEGHRSVPQIYYNGKLLVEGGYTGLIKLPEEELSKLSTTN